MRKKLVLLMMSTLICLSLAGCGKASPEAQAVIDKIESIGEVTLDDESLVNQIESDYFALTEEQQKEVKNFNKLSAARETLDKLIASKPLPFSYANWETTQSELKDMLGNPNEEYDADSGHHVLQYNNCEYDGYKGLVRYLFQDGKLVGALFIIDGFDADTYKHFNDMYVTKYGEAGFSNEAGSVWYTSNANVGITGTALFGGMINLQFYKPAEE